MGDTPGTSSARSRKFRPFSGSDSHFLLRIVPAIWLRAASMHGRLADDDDAGVETGDCHHERQFERGANGQNERAFHIVETLK